MHRLPQGNTNTGEVLHHITARSFSPRAGRRPGDCAYKQVAILLTNGCSQDLVLDATAAAHRAGIRVFTVDVGEALREELEEIASPPWSPSPPMSSTCPTSTQSTKSRASCGAACAKMCSALAFV